MKFEVYSGIDLLKLLNRIPKEPIVADTEFIVFTTSRGYFILEKRYLNVLGDNHVWVITKNQDFTEGRGPMLTHRICKNLQDAIDYIFCQPGIYGSEQRLSNYSGINIKGTPYFYSSFNGYDLIPFKVNLR